MATPRTPLVAGVLVISILALLTVPTPSGAVAYQWYVNAALEDGGSVTGTFTYETAAAAPPLPTYSIDVTPTSEDPYAYSELNPDPHGGVSLQDPPTVSYIRFGPETAGSEYSLYLYFVDIDHLTGTDPIDLLTSSCYKIERATSPGATIYITEGSMRPVPIPSALFLLGAGLFSLAAYGRRRKNR